MRRIKLILLFVVLAVGWMGWTGCMTDHPMKDVNPRPMCGSTAPSTAPSTGGGKSFGATPGGLQDMSLARDLVAEGLVPPPEAFGVEGMFSEHDLPIDGPPCSEPLCLRAVMGIAPDREGSTAAWVQIGFSSNVDPDTFERPDLTLVVAMDISGSMGQSYTGGPTPLELSKSLLREIVGELEPTDGFALVTFGDYVQTPVTLTPVVDVTGTVAIIDSLDAGGSTYMEAGLDTAFAIAVGAVGQTEEVRVLLFSDERPNVGATEPSAFQTMVADAAHNGVGLTLFGAGLGLDNALMTAMSGLRGGNALSLMDNDDVERLMADQWPWMFCPIAYRLSLTASPTDLTLRHAYGFPQGLDGQSTNQLQVETIFLSRNKGATLLQLEPDTAQGALEGSGVALQFDYQTPTGDLVTTTDGCTYTGQPLDASGQYLPQIGIARAVSLAVLVTTLNQAAGLYGAAARAQAVDLVRGALTRITTEAADLGDASLDVEVAFTAHLLALMQSGAPQSTFYPEE